MKRLSWLLCVLLLSGCGWMKFWEDDSGKDEDGVPKAGEPTPLVDFVPELEIRKLWWRIGIGGGHEHYLASLRPARDAERVYIATNDGDVTALNIGHGRKEWKVDLDMTLSGGVGVGEGLVLVASDEGEVVALAAATGDERWRTRIGSEVLAAPIPGANVVAVQTMDGKVYGLAPSTGAVLWQHQEDMPVLRLRNITAPVVSDSLVVAGFANGKVLALNAVTGDPLWDVRVGVPKGRTELERMVDVNTPLLAGDVVYATSYQGRVVAIARGTGRELWVQDGSSRWGAVLGGSQLFVVESDDTVKALNIADGRVAWKNTELLNRRLTDLTVIGDYLAVADLEGYLHLLAQSDGHLLARIKVDGEGVSVPMVASDDTLFVLDNASEITAYQFAPK